MAEPSHRGGGGQNTLWWLAAACGLMCMENDATDNVHAIACIEVETKNSDGASLCLI